MSSTPPGPDIAGHFRSIVDRLCRALDLHAVRDWTATAFVYIIIQNLRRRLERFVALKARFDAGMPPPLPPVGTRAPADPTERERSFDFVPRDRGWLKTLTEHEGAGSFWQLRELLAEPEMAAFIAADPRVGRLLRPLWWMLSPKLGLPDVLRLPPRAAARPRPERVRDARADRLASLDLPRRAPRSLRVRVPAVLQSRPFRTIPA